jgi:hypothetical protein
MQDDTGTGFGIVTGGNAGGYGSIGIGTGTTVWMKDTTINPVPNSWTTPLSTLKVSGPEPKIKTDAGEINLDELASIMHVMRLVSEKYGIPVPDNKLLASSEVLQAMWEDVRTACTNYKITEELVRSQGNSNDQ